MTRRLDRRRVMTVSLGCLLAAGSAAAQGSESDTLTARDASGGSIALGDHGVRVANPDGSLVFTLSGRYQADVGTARVRSFRFTDPYDDRSLVRRSRIEGALEIRDSAELSFQYDFADRQQPIKDAGLSLHGESPFVVSIGHFKEPFSLEELGSDTNTLLAERSLANAFVPSRNVGATIGTAVGNWTVTAGLYGGGIDTGVADEGVAGTGRVTWAPVRADGEVLHLGLSGSHRILDPRARDNQVSSQPESALFRTALVDTDAIRGADEVTLVGVEAAWQRGPVRLQGEYLGAAFGRTGGRPGLAFSGGYAEIAWTINADGRPYRLAPGYGTTFAIFGAPEIPSGQRLSRGGTGVVELAARVSAIDLQDRDVRGGREVNYAFGVNWYPEPFVRLTANYVRAHASPTPAASRTVDADLFVGRVQLYW